MKSFLTGSRAYGTPRADSDVDLCVLVGYADLVALRALAETEQVVAGAPPPDEKKSLPKPLGDEDPGDSLRFGRLNLICHTDKRAFEAWWHATEALKERRPVTRDHAIETIKSAVRDALRAETPPPKLLPYDASMPW